MSIINNPFSEQPSSDGVAKALWPGYLVLLEAGKRRRERLAKQHARPELVERTAKDTTAENLPLGVDNREPK